MPKYADPRQTETGIGQQMQAEVGRFRPQIEGLLMKG
jgi:hypothetical protein